MSPTSAAILVGGASSRMGRDKSLVEIEGRPAVVRLASLLHEGGFTDVRLIGGSSERFVGTGLAHVPDLVAGRGPLEGIRTCLTTTEEDWSLVVAVDLIALDGAALSTMRDALTRHVFDDVVLASCADGPQPLFAWWRRSTVHTIDRELGMGRRSIRNVTGMLRVASVEFPSEVLRNANRPEDLG